MIRISHLLPSHFNYVSRLFISLYLFFFSLRNINTNTATTIELQQESNIYILFSSDYKEMKRISEEKQKKTKQNKKIGEHIFYNLTD